MFKLINKLKNRKGFTLIELIVVLAVLGVIMVIAVPKFIGVQEQAKIDADYATGLLIARSAEIYAIKDMTPADIKLKLVEDFPQGIVFQSETLEGKTLNDVTLVIYNTEVKVEVETTPGNSVEVYPGKELD